MEQITGFKYKSYPEYKRAMDAGMNKAAEDFVWIGFMLKAARDTDILNKSGYATVTEFARAEYGLDKTQVSRFIRINDRFSEGGYSDCLQDNYKGFGFAKLSLMLQLPEEINGELSTEFSKAEIQALKEEVEAENRVTDIEVLLEGETEITSVMDNDLGKTVKQLGQDDPQLFANIWNAVRQQDWTVEKLQDILAPAGQKVYSVRIPGIGRKEMLLKDKYNGDEIVLIDLRGAGKKRYTWEDMLHVWETVTAADPETGYKGAWEVTYFTSWPLEEKVAPVQPEKPKKQSKVQKAPTRKVPKTAVVQEDAVPPAEEPLPGQMDIKDYSEILPANYKEIKEEAENADDSRADDAGAGSAGGQLSSGGDESGIPAGGEGSSNEAVDGNVIPDELRAAGVSGTSGEISKAELVDRIEKTRDKLFDAVYEMMKSNCEIEYENKYAYARAIDLAAAIEQLILSQQKERTAGKDG